MRKINWKKILMISCWCLGIGILFYTRFINLGWGLPYPMHPDERNMADAVQQLHCEISNFKFPISSLQDCFNPHFFAYGQFPLYLASFLIWGYREIVGMFKVLGKGIGFIEATMALRIISAVASVIMAMIILKIINSLIDWTKKKMFPVIPPLFSLLVIVFSPALIQFAHFGTTESLLMMFYSIIIYLSLLLIQKKLHLTYYSLLVSLFCGLAVATKISSAVFFAIPFISFIYHFQKHIKHIMVSIVSVVLLSLILFILFSPHTLISFKEFMLSSGYESAIALGHLPVFYTQQFQQSIPIIFQFSRIFPYALGLPVFLLFLAGFALLPWNKKELNFLRLSFISYFLPNAFFFVKWTRFMAPIFPLMVVFAILAIYQLYKYSLSKIGIISNLKSQRLNPKSKFKVLNFTLDFALCALIFTLILPGIAYLSIYQSPDVRFQATKWIRSHIPQRTLILSETANVVDIPLSSPEYRTVPFDFYNLDKQTDLQYNLSAFVKNSHYIIVPSRRIYMNYTCQNSQFLIFNFQSIFNFKFLNSRCNNLKNQYPLLNEYYRRLFTGELGFKQVAEFTSYPRLVLFGKTVLEFPDEQAEETWSVFDHPVIRIYKKM